ncbi:MAG: helix-turn-helix domain-containing protein [Actinobacteria bacterium]|nr:helix-turn-helix domain-containing protein [Actinomycetota bacterium]MBI3686421.1 helix-turn-helix domain-containing protein [Actinomycetota bacterium]
MMQTVRIIGKCQVHEPGVIAVRQQDCERGRATVAEDLSPTLRRRELGARLRDLRLTLDLTLEDVAASLLCSPAKISRIETGARNVSQRDVRDLCRLYGVADTGQLDLLTQLAREGRRRAWWQDYDELTSTYSTYIGLEQAAVTVSEFNLGVIPGLLQTERYTRGLIDGMDPQLLDEEVDQRVEVRLLRQRRLSSSDPPVLRAVLDESALWRVVGDADVMAEQLLALRESARSTTSDIRVLPFSAGAYPALNGQFIILEFKNQIIADTVYVESLSGNSFFKRSADLERYHKIFAEVQEIALSPDESLNLLDLVRQHHIQHQKK